MINTYYQLPEVYYKESRDFQVLGRVYDIIFNYLKTSIDTIYHNPLDKSTDKNLLDLLACTLGFETKHNYDINQLYAICSSFSEILKVKGTKKSIELTVKALLNSQGIDKKPEVAFDRANNHQINIFIPSGLVDTTLLQDVLEYILPVGLTYCIINSVNIENSDSINSTYIRSGLDEYSRTLHTAGTEDINNYTKINYISKYDDEITDYENLIAPGMIDNVTVTALEPNKDKQGE